MRNKLIFRNDEPKPEGLFETLIKRFMEKRLIRYAEGYGKIGEHFAIFAHDLVGIKIELFGRLERDDIEDLFCFLDPAKDLFNGVALDVGANIGNHTIPIAQKFDRVFAYEPNPLVFDILRFNTRYLRNVDVFNYGLGEIEESSMLIGQRGNVGASTISKFKSESQGVAVELKTLDNVLNSFSGDISLIKIDVEGHELNVLRGGMRVILDKQPIIVFEQNDSEFIDGSTPCIDLLREMGYTICWWQYDREQSKYSIIREIRKIFDRIARRRPGIFTGDVIPIKSHPMILAVPKKLRTVLFV